MTTQQTKVERARQELMALSALIRRPPLDDVQLRMGVALTVADAIDTLFAQPEAPTPSPELTARMVALDWFSTQRRLSLAFHAPMYGDDDDQSEEWRVSRESGPINDREWDVVGRGTTAAEAIIAAHAAELEPVDGDLIEALTAKIINAAHADGNTLPHPSAWWSIVCAARRLRDHGEAA